MILFCSQAIHEYRGAFGLFGKCARVGGFVYGVAAVAGYFDSVEGHVYVSRCKRDVCGAGVAGVNGMYRAEAEVYAYLAELFE